MQLTELKMLMLLDVAGGRGTTPLGPGVRTGGRACDTASRLSDRSSNGSLFDGDSSLTAGTPLGLTCCAEGSEGRLWEDLLRGGGWGGVSKPGWGAA